MMSRLSQLEAVTVLIPHYQTRDAICLCLRSLRYYTKRDLIVRVLDNGSQDDSLPYLRSVDWVECVERSEANHIWKSHYEALNEALPSVTTPTFLIMHSDTFVCHAGWLDFLERKLASMPQAAAVGSRHQRIRAHTLIHSVLSLVDRFRKAHEHDPGVPVLRSLCCLYRTADVMRVEGRFVTKAGEDINYALNRSLVESGKRLVSLPGTLLSRYLFHASAGTLLHVDPTPVDGGKAGNPVEEGRSYLTRKIVRRSMTQYESFVSHPARQRILLDASLDR